MFAKLTSKVFGGPTAPTKLTPDEFAAASDSTDEPASADEVSVSAESTGTFAAEPPADPEMAAEEPPWESEDQTVDGTMASEDVDMASGDNKGGETRTGREWGTTI